MPTRRSSSSVERRGRHINHPGWEVWGPLRPLYEAGRYAEAAEQGRELLADNPDMGGLYYNVACCEALAGRSAEAIAHLRHAIELADVTRDYAAQDSDLDSIRGDPAFAALLAAPA
jgi:tetratricopeptide (TPR) repeat protein